MEPSSGTCRSLPRQAMFSSPILSGAIRSDRIAPFQGLGVVERQVAGRLADQGRRGVGGGLGPAGNDDHQIGAERGKLIDDIQPRPVADAGEQHHRRHADAHGQQHQQGADPIAAQAHQGKADSVEGPHGSALLGIAGNAAVHHPDPPLGPLADLRVMGDHHQGLAFAVQLFHQFDDLTAGMPVEIAGGFVGEQHRRLIDHRPGDGHPLALAAGEFVRFMMPSVAKPEGLDQTGAALVPFPARNPGQQQGQLDVLLGGEPRDEMEKLEDEADLAAAGGGQLVVVEAGDILAFEEIGAAVRGVEQADDVEQGRFARAGRPHDRQVLARLDGQRDLVHGPHLLAADGENTADLAQFDHFFAALSVDCST